MMMRRTILAAGLALAAALCGGCSDGLNRGGKLSGKVYLGDAPLGGGRVEIFSENGKHSVSCQIRPDGGYVLSEPPLGKCMITVTTRHLEGMKPPARGGKGKANQGSSPGMVLPDDVGLVYAPIPERYEQREKTDLTVTVKRGDQDHDIRLSPK
jgi:hypothetical protein